MNQDIQMFRVITMLSWVIVLDFLQQVTVILFLVTLQVAFMLLAITILTLVRTRVMGKPQAIIILISGNLLMEHPAWIIKQQLEVTRR